MQTSLYQDIIIKMANVKNEERVVREIREKQRLSYKGTPIRLSGDFSRNSADQKKVAQ